MWLSPWCVCVTNLSPEEKRKKEKKKEKKTGKKNASVSRQSQMQLSDWSRRQSRVQNRTPTPETDPIRGASRARLFGSDSRGSRLSSPGTCIQQLPVSSTRLRYYHHTHTHTPPPPPPPPPQRTVLAVWTGPPTNTSSSCFSGVDARVCSVD